MEQFCYCRTDPRSSREFMPQRKKVILRVCLILISVVILSGVIVIVLLSLPDKFENCRKFTNVSQERLYHDDAVKFCQDMEATLLRESSIEDVETCGMMPEDEVWIDRDNHGGSDKNLCEVYKDGYWTGLDCATPRRFICKK